MKNKHIIFIFFIVLIVSLIVVVKRNYFIKIIIDHWFNYPSLPLIRQSHKNSFEVKFNDRIWAHAINNIEKLKMIENLYVGIESDVMFDTIKFDFDIYHWPEAKSTGLKYKDFLSSIEQPKSHYFWLDFKNLKVLSIKMQKRALDSLQSIVNKFGIKKRIIVESENPKMLTLFSDSGFYTSYWIPHIRTNFLTRNNIVRWYNLTKEGIENNKITVLSGSSEMLPLVHRYFPNFKFMTWGLNTNNIVFLTDEY
jgi:hypothetical protein